MADDMIGTLFESDATSILDSEASHLLTELESMATDSGQPPPQPPQPQNPYFDYGGGVQQPMQSPVSQAMQMSPAGSMHSPGGLISPSTNTQQHFGSPPPQQNNPALQRQVFVAFLSWSPHTTDIRILLADWQEGLVRKLTHGTHM